MQKNILIIGSGGREHALGWKLSQSASIGTLYFAPGNAGTEKLGINIPIAVDDVEHLCQFALEHSIDLTIVGPEASLEKGVVNRFEEAGLAIFGPTEEAARLETSKVWSSLFMERHGIPHPRSYVFSDIVSARKFFEEQKEYVNQYVIKVDGLASGKGVFLPDTFEDATRILKMILVDREFGQAGTSIVIQERLQGQEVSVLSFSDGTTVIPMPPAQDYKRLLDNNEGPMTGGVGAIAPSPAHVLPLLTEILETIVKPTIDGMKKERHPFVGVLYAGIMLTEDGPKVLEYNVRFGDPETQVLMMLLTSDLFEVISACIHHTLSESSVVFSSDHALTVILSASGYPGFYKTNTSIKGLDSGNEVTVFHAGTIRKNNEIVTNGGRVLAVTARGKTKKEAWFKAYDAIGEHGVSFEGMQLRRDIGAQKENELDKGMFNVVNGEKKREEEISSIPKLVYKNGSPTSLKTYRLEIFLTIPDMRAAVRKEKIQQRFRKSLKISVSDVYTIETSMADDDILNIQELLVNPITQQGYVSTLQDKHLPSFQFSWAIEVGFLPGVTDNVATTTKEMIVDARKKRDSEVSGIYTSHVYYLTGEISKKEAQEIGESMFNPLIERAVIKSFLEYTNDQGMDIVVPKVAVTSESILTIVDLDISDSELETLGREGIQNNDGTRRGPLALDLYYLKTIQNYFHSIGRNPTDLELESIAQTWSEHCKHTIFRDPIDDIEEGLYERYIKHATAIIRQHMGDNDICVSVFSDNSGAIIFDDQYLVTDKVETHNSPSALDPFGGAITGIVGVNRDTLGFGLGAKPILNRYGFCLADPKNTSHYFRDEKLTQPLLSSARIFDGVVSGVNSGGNCSGIPTPLGFLYVDQQFRGKPLVFAGTVGLLPRAIDGERTSEKKARNGDYIVMIGGRVGIDGIHGATFSSEALTGGSPATAVQIGDPITQKKLSDALIKEARDKHLYHSITDNGAGGLSCSVAEMAKESGGCNVQLELVPLKYQGLEPWQIWISESQERMTLAVSKSNWEKFSLLMHKRGVEATIIGTFTDSGRCVVSHNTVPLMDIDMDFLHDGLPKRRMKTTWINPPMETSFHPAPADFTQSFLALLGRINIGSTEIISTQYDHEVQGTSVLKPLQGKGRVNGDAAVIKPVPESTKGIVVSYGLYPSYSNLDPYAMAVASVDSAIRNIIVVGGNRAHTAIIDNFCWCDSKNPSRLGQLKEAAKGLHDAAIGYLTPIISGKDSMFNDFKGFTSEGASVHVSIPPTLLISSLSVMDDVKNVVSLDVKAAGDLIYLLGETHEELGGSEYAALIDENNTFFSPVPRVDISKNSRLYDTYSLCLQQGLIASAIGVGRGGLAAAIGKMSIAGDLGVSISLETLEGMVQNDQAALFSESQGRILVTINPLHKKSFEEQCSNISLSYLGKVEKHKSIEVFGIKGKPIVTAPLSKSNYSYKSTFGIIQHHKPKALIIAGYGINCEEETALAFTKAGGESRVVHINDLIEKQQLFSEFQMMAIPGGFAFGDDTGSGNAFAQKMKHHLWGSLMSFVKEDHLIIGICNGFQVLTNLGLLPALDNAYGSREVALIHNDNATYTDRWVDLKIQSTSPWYQHISTISLPIAHGEGKFYASPEILHRLREKKMIAATYTLGEICTYQSLPANPNGSIEDIAAITNEDGKILGMMPHPERAISFTQLPHWTFLKEMYQRQGKPVPVDGPGIQIFQNAIQYFQ